MHVLLTLKLEKFVKEKVESGLYNNASELPESVDFMIWRIVGPPTASCYHDSHGRSCPTTVALCGEHGPFRRHPDPIGAARRACADP